MLMQAEIMEKFRWFFWRIEDTTMSFWNFLIFKTDLVQSFEDWMKLKMPSEIKPPFTSSDA